jgi:DNA-binding NtrC family response regulator
LGVVLSPPLLLYSHPDTGELIRRRWHLVVVEGNDEGCVAEISHAPALVGAAPAATLVLSDDTVSRYHLEIDVFADGVRLRDLDSTNGTFVGDRKIRDAFIEKGEEFRVGRTIVRLDSMDESAASEIDTDPRGVPPGAVDSAGEALAVAGSTREILRLVRKIAPSSSTVLFEGERGTGRATFAKLLHDLSPRKGQPFVPFAPDSIVDEEAIRDRMFGRPSRASLFESAKGGTLFIENIEHLPESVQGPLVRAIESGEIKRPGEDRMMRIDVRIVASTAASLRSKEGFDPGLYRRIAVVRLRVPALRERPEDVGALAESFLEQIAGRRMLIGDRTLALLSPLTWPGNLDQLRALLSRMIDPARTDEAGDPLEDAMRTAYILDVVSRKRGHVTRAAQELSMGTRDLFAFLSRKGADLDAM